MNMAVEPHAEATRTARHRWDARYASGPTPWDTHTTPPEVIQFWSSGSLPRSGCTLDLGCGPGTNLRYLARLGLHAIGVDIAGAPLAMAQQRIRARAPELVPHVDMILGDVCALPFHNLDARYILDIGCLHSMSPELRPSYAAGVLSNLGPNGYYHLYAFDRTPEEENPAQHGPVGLAEGEVAELFAPYLHVVEETVSRPDRRPCRWYLLQRKR